jgi:hypothetical protein|nr:MAG TPA: FeoB-associated Cys-rich membrane protein [Caudoviricetes sp.]DAN01244.1 MAG TPA: FeoB-associated Cys-rich membrane protein [Caudoviricetes sp.]DAX44506.1 MAG TPA: FeoB-associated Cys-rich membrane protein [Caudoviricetes sp.]DAX49824.1 MAG TPA: FeoB-associated Cys-rich membrane protein [Caudoviricetes sp.]
MKKEIKLKKRKITFEVKKTTLKEKIEFLIAIIIIAIIIYLVRR